MDSNNITPSPTPTNEPTPPVDQPPQQPVTSMPPKSKLPLLIVLLVVVLIAGGVGAYFLFMKNDKKNDDKTAQTTTTNTQGTEQTEQPEVGNDEPAATTTSSLSNDDKDYGSGTITVTHPKSWTVEKGADQYGANQLRVISPTGNALRLTQQTGGVGGTCEPDTDKYTVVKKIPTKDPSRFFTEYTTTNANFSTRTLAIESFAHASAKHKALTEGQSNTDVCSNIGLVYAIVDGMFVKLEDAKGQPATYNAVKADTEFITMLESFTVTDK